MYREPVNPVWAYGAAAGLFLFAVLAIMVAPYVAPPSPGRVTGVLFGAGTSSATAIDAVVRADPAAELVDLRLKGRLVFLVYHRADFPARIARLGALRSFDAIAAGCHGAGQATPLVHLAP